MKRARTPRIELRWLICSDERPAWRTIVGPGRSEQHDAVTPAGEAAAGRAHPDNKNLLTPFRPHNVAVDRVELATRVALTA